MTIPFSPCFGRACLVALLLAMASNSLLAETHQLALQRGGQLQVRVDLPPGDGSVPTLVLAPGQNYPMTRPVLDETAHQLVARGVGVVRFDWAYTHTAPKGQPSEGLAHELDDLQAVIAFARRHPRVDALQLSVGGKSLGSVVAWRALVADAQLRSAVLLTPICSQRVEGGSPKSIVDETYPGARSVTRPVLFLAGDSDPLCDGDVLGRLALSMPIGRFLVVGGDHGFERRHLPAEQAGEFRSTQLFMLAGVAADFLARVRTGAVRAP